jgi:hypothetical protein
MKYLFDKYVSWKTIAFVVGAILVIALSYFIIVRTINMERLKQPVISTSNYIEDAKTKSNVIKISEEKNEYDNSEIDKWKDISLCAHLVDGKVDFKISYPPELDLDEYKTAERCLSQEFGQPNFVLNYSNNPNVAKVELTTDFNYIFYLLVSKKNTATVYSLKMADLRAKIVKVVDFKAIPENYALEHYYHSMLMPYIKYDYLIYNWFSENLDYSDVNRSSDSLYGKIVSFNSVDSFFDILFESPCDEPFTLFPPNYDISHDGKNVVVSCDGQVYLSDWNNIDVIELPERQTVVDRKADRVWFGNDGKINFVDYSEEEALRAPIHELDLDSGQLKNVGEAYLGY